jgi:UDP-glucose 4-epimerase
MAAISNPPVSVVTGAAGFIGSHLVDRLLELGHRVIGIDNLVLGRLSNLESELRHPQFAFRQLDLNEPGPCLQFLREQHQQYPVGTVWHLAANSDIQAGVKDSDVDLRLTFLTTYNVLKIMEQLGIREIVFASTSAIYGDLGKTLREDSGPLFPVSSYGAMKLASEGAISAAVEKFIERAWICRFPNVVGSRATHGAIYDFLKKLGKNPKELEVLGDGTQDKPYLHVSELIDAMRFIYEHSRERLNFFNIAPAVGSTTVRYMAEATVRAAAPGAEIRYTGGSRGWVGDVPQFSYSIEKLRALGWSPKLSSNEAVDLAIRENLGI